MLYGYSSRDYPEGNVLRGHVIDWRTTRTMLAGDLGHRSPAFLLMAEVFPGVVRGPRVGARPNDAARPLRHSPARRVPAP